MARYSVTYTVNGECRLYFESESGEGYDEFELRCRKSIAEYELEHPECWGGVGKLDDNWNDTTRVIWYS